MTRNKFDPDDLSLEALRYLGDHLENFLKMKEKMMFIPDGVLTSEQEKQHKEGMERAYKLANKLKKGKTSVFIEKEQDI